MDNFTAPWKKIPAAKTCHPIKISIPQVYVVFIFELWNLYNWFSNTIYTSSGVYFVSFMDYMNILANPPDPPISPTFMCISYYSHIVHILLYWLYEKKCWKLVHMILFYMVMRYIYNTMYNYLHMIYSENSSEGISDYIN